MHPETLNETYVPAAQTETQEHSRLSGTNVDKKRPQGAEPTKSKGAAQIDRKRRKVVSVKYPLIVC